MIRYLLMGVVALVAFAQTPAVRRPGVPAAPTAIRAPQPASNPAACGASPHCGVLNWLWSQGSGGSATGFNIKRATISGGPYTAVGSVSSPTILSFTDLSVTGNILVEGTKYFWITTAVGPGGESGPSNETSGTVPFQTPPSPSGLVVSVF